jgi:c-di-GMP-binding flagellar brake protein YcgR
MGPGMNTATSPDEGIKSSDENEIEKHFQQRKVSIEIGTQVLMQINGVAGRFPSQFVGRDQDRFMIFKIPRAQVNLSNRLMKGAPLVVRYRHQGRIFGFESMIVGIIAEPFGLLFINSPNIIEEHRLRKNTRVDCYLPCSVELVEGQAGGVIVNISSQGARCLFSNMKSNRRVLDELRDQVVKVHVALRESEAPLLLTARVLSAQQFHGAVSAGLRFENVDEASQSKLVTHISEWDAS